MLGAMAAIAFSLAACVKPNGLDVLEKKMAANEMSLWQVIDHVGSHLPIRRDMVEKLFNVTLTQLDGSNKYVTFWNGVGGSLQQSVSVSRIVLGIRNDDARDPGALTLHLSGNCMTLDDVKKRYGEVTMVGVPHGRSPDEETTFEARTNWGKLIFGLAQRNPGCLSSVGFVPVKS